MKFLAITVTLTALATPILAHKDASSADLPFHSSLTYTGGPCTELNENQYGCKMGTGSWDRQQVVICKDLVWRVIVNCPKYWGGGCFQDDVKGVHCEGKWSPFPFPPKEYT